MDLDLRDTLANDDMTYTAFYKAAPSTPLCNGKVRRFYLIPAETVTGKLLDEVRMTFPNQLASDR